MSQHKIVITIDGWSSCGKSTLAKQLAKALGYLYIDSGAMYRAITLYFLRNHVDWSRHHAVERALKNIYVEFVYNEHSQDSELMMAGSVVTVIPVLALFLAMQRYYIEGLLLGSVKG